MDTPSSTVGPGIGAFIAFFVLALCLWLLMRNMNGRMRRMAYREQRRVEILEAQQAHQAQQAQQDQQDPKPAKRTKTAKGRPAPTSSQDPTDLADGAQAGSDEPTP
jgi:predicted lipid-binding transport protein (Tim44 family)